MIPKEAETFDYRYRNRFSIAPMLHWTDRHCRFFHRQLTKKAVLHTEMIVADALLYGKRREEILAFSSSERPLVLQLAGSDPKKLAEAARIAVDFGYDAINLNVGCPSQRVQYGDFGACLMLNPKLVGQAVYAMKKAVSVPITIKCRIGIGEQETEGILDLFGDCVFEQGADALWIHARKVWLKGLSPKENREVPSLDYERVYRFKKNRHKFFVGVNGGVHSLKESIFHLGYVDGVMMGRIAYHNPRLLSKVDQFVYGRKEEELNYMALIDRMASYIEDHLCRGGRVSHVTRHMLGLFQACPGALLWRRILSTEATARGATSSVLYKAFSRVSPENILMESLEL
ncbi:MAG: tRNA-dihydrouridine synthase A [Candidatus Tokpelaia sp. JSC161]|nr:MAG: tRNA-dihydrouridine synthase A [Candidatus Tokpelaia sp. JSC161]